MDNITFCKTLEKFVGLPYWYGTCLYRCTPSLLCSKTIQYPSHYQNARKPRYNDDIQKRKVCADCAGIIKGFFWTDEGKNVIEYMEGAKTLKNSYQKNFPDVGSESMGRYAKENGANRGPISNMPDVPGIILHKVGHVGVYIGNGKVIEAKGFSYGVIKSDIKSTQWLDWFYLPSKNIKYETDIYEMIEEEKETEYVVKPGDSLWKISVKYYGYGSKWKLIANANEITNTIIHAGQVLKIPKGGK